MFTEEARSVPTAIPEEKALISAALQSVEAFKLVAYEVAPAAFYLYRHELIWQALVYLHECGKPIDLISVAGQLKANGVLDMAGGMLELADILNAGGSVMAVEHYATAILDTYQLRRLIEAGGKIRALGYEAGNVEDATAKAEAAVLDITRQIGRGAIQGASAAEAGKALTQHIDARRDVNALPDVRTGFDELDRNLLLMPKEMHLIAARPGVGKTALLGSIVAEVAGSQDRPVEWYSLEMDRVAVMARLVAQLTGIPVDRILRAKWLSRDDMAQIKGATEEIAAWPLNIADRGEFTALGIRSYARRRAMKVAPALVITDHIGLTRVAAERRRDPRVQQIGEISKQFKDMAAELDCPHLVAAQLNRAIEMRAQSAKAPQLSDLRESGDLEQDAYSVVFIHRNGSDAKLIIAKNRNGPLTTVESVEYDQVTTRFKNKPSYQGVAGYE